MYDNESLEYAAQQGHDYHNEKKIEHDDESLID